MFDWCRQCYGTEPDCPWKNWNAVLSADSKLSRLAQSSDPQIFAESIFPKAFGTAAQDSYMEVQTTFASLFEDMGKYKAVMSALAELLYRDFRKKKE